MLIKTNKFKDITAFAVYGQLILGLKENKLFDLQSDTLLKVFKNTPSRILTNESAWFISAPKSQAYKVISGNFIPIDSPAFYCFDSYYLDSLEHDSGVSLKTNDGLTMWESDIIPLDILKTDEHLLFLNSKERRNKSIVCIHKRDGRVLWESFLNGLDAIKIQGSRFGKMLGASTTHILITLRNPSQLILFSLETGNLDFSTSQEDIEEFMSCGVDIESFKLVDKSLVHPYLEYDLNSKEIKNRAPEIKTDQKYVPDVFPFIVTEKLIFTGVQSITKGIDKLSECHLICIDRISGEIVYSKLINDEYPEAGVKQLKFQEGKLFVFDSLETLHVYQVENQVA